MKVTLTICAVLFASAVSLQSAYAGDQGKSQGQTQKQARNADLGQKGTKVVAGEVIDTRNVKLQGAAGDAHKLVQIENAQGQSIVVDLGLEADQIDVQRGDRLVVIGKSARIDNRPVIFAQYAGELQQLQRGQQQARRQEQQDQQQAAVEPIVTEDLGDLYVMWAGEDEELTVDEWDRAIDERFGEEAVNLSAERWDDNGNGVISMEEFEQAVFRVGMIQLER